MTRAARARAAIRRSVAVLIAVLMLPVALAIATVYSPVADAAAIRTGNLWTVSPGVSADIQPAIDAARDNGGGRVQAAGRRLPAYVQSPAPQQRHGLRRRHGSDDPALGAWSDGRPHDVQRHRVGRQQQHPGLGPDARRPEPARLRRRLHRSAPEQRAEQLPSSTSPPTTHPRRHLPRLQRGQRRPQRSAQRVSREQQLPQRHRADPRRLERHRRLPGQQQQSWRGGCGHRPGARRGPES